MFGKKSKTPSGGDPERKFYVEGMAGKAWRIESPYPNIHQATDGFPVVDCWAVKLTGRPPLLVTFVPGEPPAGGYVLYVWILVDGPSPWTYQVRLAEPPMGRLTHLSIREQADRFIHNLGLSLAEHLVAGELLPPGQSIDRQMWELLINSYYENP